MSGDFVHKLLSRLKPGVSKRTHLFSAALLWSVVGLGLLTRGTLWLTEDTHIIFTVPAILFGTLKSLFILDKSARKSIDRILHLDDGSCLGAVYSVRTWLLVVAMMLLGVVLRHLSLPNLFVGTLYAAIGWSLLFSSRLGWKSWYKTGTRFPE